MSMPDKSVAPPQPSHRTTQLNKSAVTACFAVIDSDLDKKGGAAKDCFAFHSKGKERKKERTCNAQGSSILTSHAIHTWGSAICVAGFRCDA